MVETTEQFLAAVRTIVNLIETEDAMFEMREYLASGIQKIGERQGVTEKELNQVLKDVSSATPGGAETAVARGKYETLGTRLNIEEAIIKEAIAQKIGGTTLVGMANLDQEVKSKFTGGAVAVVGPNAVTESTVVDRQITPRKSSYFTKNPLNLINPLDFTTGYVDATGAIVGTPGASRVSQTIVELSPNTTYRLQSETPLTGTTIYLATYLNGVFRIRYLFTSTANATFTTGPNDRGYRISCIAGDEFKLYLHEGTSELPFQPTLVMDPKFLPAVDTPVNATLDQTDFVEVLAKHNRTGLPMKAKLEGGTNVKVYVPISQGKYTAYYFEKNPHDDFILFASAVIGSFNGEVYNQEQYMMAGSNKEFAFRVRPAGTSKVLAWLPEHEGIGTAFKINQSIMFDGVEKFGNTSQTMQDVNTVTIIQQMKLVYPGDSLPTALLNIVTTINADGVTYSGEIEWMLETEIERGYVAMFPTVVPPVDTLRTSMGIDYDATLTSGTTALTESDQSNSYAYVNKKGTVPNTGYVVAQTIINPTETFRKGKTGRKIDGVVWIEHRNGGLVQKVYPQIYQNHVVMPGQKINFGATMYAGLLPMAGSLLK